MAVLTVRWKPGWRDAMTNAVVAHMEATGAAAVTSARSELSTRTLKPGNANVIDYEVNKKGDLRVGYKANHPGWYLAFGESGTIHKPPTPVLPEAVREAIRTPHNKGAFS